MSSNVTPSKKTAAKKTAAKKTSAASTAARKTAVNKAAPPPRNRAAHTPKLVADAASVASADEKTVIATFLTARRRRRQLLALKLTCYLMAAGALTFICLTIRQLTIASPVASAYGTLAGVFVAATGVSCTVYHFMRRRNKNQDE
ncbi:hypothetical protein ABT258_37675 [Streptomyces tendae]|uniref:hypothetical protein n=1 Tax=Streptomyces tendae TaxID=1932 RepID=UPI00332791F6